MLMDQPRRKTESQKILMTLFKRRMLLQIMLYPIDPWINKFNEAIWQVFNKTLLILIKKILEVRNPLVVDLYMVLKQEEVDRQNLRKKKETSQLKLLRTLTTIIISSTIHKLRLKTLRCLVGTSFRLNNITDKEASRVISVDPAESQLLKKIIFKLGAICNIIWLVKGLTNLQIWWVDALQIKVTREELIRHRIIQIHKDRSATIPSSALVEAW